MSVQGPQTLSTMTIKEMAISFLPIILFSIVLPLIDIVTDLRMIIRLFSGITGCVSYEDMVKLNVSSSDRQECHSSDDLSTFCQLHPNVCKLEKHEKLDLFRSSSCTHGSPNPSTNLSTVIPSASAL